MPTDPPVLGTKWLSFWTYVGIPVVIVGAFLLTLDLPRFRYENIPIALLCIAVAVGLHKRRLWRRALRDFSRPAGARRALATLSCLLEFG